MQQLIIEKSFNNPDQAMELPKVKGEIVHFDGFTMIRVTFAPGMLYSRDVRPHIPQSQEQAPVRPVYCESGHIHFVQPDGSSLELVKGGVYLVPPWENSFEDSWVVGDEPCVLVSFISQKVELKGNDAE